MKAFSSQSHQVMQKRLGGVRARREANVGTSSEEQDEAVALALAPAALSIFTPGRLTTCFGFASASSTHHLSDTTPRCLPPFAPAVP